MAEEIKMAVYKNTGRMILKTKEGVGMALACRSTDLLALHMHTHVIDH